MKQITIAKSAGFCFGVDRAVRMTYEALEQRCNFRTNHSQSNSCG